MYISSSVLDKRTCQSSSMILYILFPQSIELLGYNGGCCSNFKPRKLRMVMNSHPTLLLHLTSLSVYRMWVRVTDLV